MYRPPPPFREKADMRPVLFEFGPFQLHTYGLTAALAFLAGLYYMQWQARRNKLDVEFAADLAFLFVIVGVIGSRILYIAVTWDRFRDDLWSLFAIWKGGLVFYGGPLLVLPVAFWVFHRRKVPSFAYADLGAAAMILALGIGRLGCLAAGCCYGKVTSVPWGIVYPATVGADYLRQGLPVHPTPIYEFVGCLSIVGISIWLNAIKKQDGIVTGAVFMMYAIVRSTVERFRADEVRGFVGNTGLSTSEFISIFSFLFGLAVIVYVLRRNVPKYTFEGPKPDAK